MHRWTSIRTIVLLVVMMASASSMSAQALVADQMYHTAWLARDGAPTLISDIAQTTDGYLWLAAETGLIRFDGVHFERYTPPDGTKLPGSGTFGLRALPDGSLWIGWRLHGVSRLKDGVLTTYDRVDGLPSSTIFAIVQDGAGRMWAASQGGMSLLEGNKWHRVGPEMNLAPGASAGLPFVDKSGALWVSDRKKASVLRPGSNRFEDVSAPLKVVNFAQDRGGAVWGFDEEGALCRMTGPGAVGRIYRLSEKPVRSNQGIFDRRGDLWMGNADNGLYRVKSFAEFPDHDQVMLSQIYSVKTGELSADGSDSPFEDREGNIWVLTVKGLDRFRKNHFTSTNLPTRFENILLLPSHGDSVLAGAMNQELVTLPGPIPDKVPPTTPSSIASIYRDPDGVSWIGGRHAFWRLDQKGYTAIERPNPEYDVQAITTDGHGGLWVAIGRGWAYHYTGGQWLPYGNNPKMPKLCPFSEMTDATGRVWFGYLLNQIAILDPSGDVRMIAAKDGLDLGAVSALTEHGDHVWAGGEKGLVRFSQDHFEPVIAFGDRALHGVSGIVERTNGDLWLNEAENIALIPAAELQRAHTSPGYQVHVTFFDALDGLNGAAPQLRPIPTEIQSESGKLWFSLGSDAVWIDPDKIFHNTVVPDVDIQSVTVDGHLYRLLKDLKLPVKPSSIQIDYTAPSLTIPERVMFRYKLQGVDRDWQEAGTRRQAFYTHLSPGTYHFTVLGCNNDGLWSPAGTTLTFVVPPTITQTLWFKILCFGVVGCALFLIVRWRLEELTRRAREQISERMVERERIARELHDTLLQGFQGLILRFGTATRQLGENTPVKAMMESALDRADEVLVEGRERVLALRSDGLGAPELSAGYIAVGEAMKEEHSTNFEMKVTGIPRVLHPVVKDEAYWIGREAILNAFAHARAKNILVTLVFEDKALTLCWVDDGRGIDPVLLANGGRDGHWGLQGMRERARKIGASLEIKSNESDGTTIQLKIPSSVAYQSGRLHFWKLRARRLWRAAQ